MSFPVLNFTDRKRLRIIRRTIAGLSKIANSVYLADEKEMEKKMQDMLLTHNITTIDLLNLLLNRDHTS